MALKHDKYDCFSLELMNHMKDQHIFVLIFLSCSCND